MNYREMPIGAGDESGRLAKMLNTVELLKESL